MRKRGPALSEAAAGGKPMPAASPVMNRAVTAGRAGQRSTLVMQVLRTAFRLGFSGSAAIVVGSLVMSQPVSAWMVAAVAVALVLSMVAGLAADRLQARAETDLASSLRDDARRRLSGMPARRLAEMPAGSLVVSMQRHPDQIAALVIGHRSAAMMMAVGPLLAFAALMTVSWQAALLVLALTPVMIVFFILVGGAIRRRADAQERAFGRLAGQFSDRIRTLPTILANDAFAVEEAKLSRRLTAYADNTMGVLRIAFLNAGIIDFFSSLSIAMLAVFLGLGHLHLASVPGFSDLELWQSLFILMIAPEYFAPMRRYAEQYHAKAEGVAAAAAMDELLREHDVATASIAQVDIALDGADLPKHGLVAVAGPSGSGKSTLLRRLAGVEPGQGRLAGVLAAPRAVWIATDSPLPQGTLAQAIQWNIDGVSPSDVMLAAGQVGLLDDELLPGGLNAAVAAGGANLSGGQRLRVAIARALVSSRDVIADEPTAKLDPDTAEAIRLALCGIASTRLVVVATHDARLLALADRVIEIAGTQSVEAVK